MLEATCAVPLYRVECDNQGPGKRTAPQPWDGQDSPTVSRDRRTWRVIVWLLRLCRKQHQLNAVINILV